MKPRVSRARTLEAELSIDVKRRLAEIRAGAYPLSQYAADPVRYVTERLRVEVILPHQRMILEAFGRAVRGEGEPRVSCRSGHKIGKTKLACWLALWFYECFDKARVLMCAAIEQQTKDILWRELWNVVSLATKAGALIDGKFGRSPTSGFISSDGLRSIKGISGREIESVAGYSGRQLLIVDEASHLPEDKSQAFAGNSLGGDCYMFWISNPTRTAGPFYDTFHDKARWWQVFHIDSREVARWAANTGTLVPGIVTLAMVEVMKEMYGGEDSPFFTVRVLGQWLRNETGRCVAMHEIEAAQARWTEVEETGLLQIGYDPAGAGDAGDQHAWAVVRGAKCLAVIRARGLDEEQALAKSYAILEVHAKDSETPRIVIDSDGPIGASLYGRFRAEAEHRTLRGGRLFEVRGVKASSPYVRDPSKFERVKDELVWSLAHWIKTGGIPADADLQMELYTPQWSSLPNGKLRSTPKIAIRDALNRSPDSFDALALAVWSPIGLVVAAQESSPQPDVYARPSAEHTFDPYNAERAFRD